MQKQYNLFLSPFTTLLSSPPTAAQCDMISSSILMPEIFEVGRGIKGEHASIWTHHYPWIRKYLSLVGPSLARVCAQASIEMERPRRSTSASTTVSFLGKENTTRVSLELALNGVVVYLLLTVMAFLTPFHMVFLHHTT